MDGDDPWGVRGGSDEERYREGEENYPGWGRTSPGAVLDGATGVFGDGQLVFHFDASRQFLMFNTPNLALTWCCIGPM